MILYFSGTGNSKYCAEFLGDKLEDKIVSINDMLRNASCNNFKSDTPWIIVCPIYAWRIPRVVSNWLESVKLEGSRDIYFVVTCGSESYNADKYLKKLCLNKGFNYRGVAEVIMPGNYIIMFDSPTQTVIDENYLQAPKTLENIAYYIVNNKTFPKFKINFVGKFMSSIVNSVFYPMFVNDKKFVVNDNCISCRKCEDNCPLGNIRIVDGKPTWNGNCTQCMACISNCPVNAIEYGKSTVGKKKYICKL